MDLSRQTINSRKLEVINILKSIGIKNFSLPVRSFSVIPIHEGRNILNLTMKAAARENRLIQYFFFFFLVIKLLCIFMAEYDGRLVNILTLSIKLKDKKSLKKSVAFN